MSAVRRTVAGLCLPVLLAAVVATGLPAGAAAEQASQPSSAAAGQLDAGRDHSCALLPDARVRCWGFSGNGQLGYGNTDTIGDDETPGSVAPVDLGSNLTARAITAGGSHTCALLDGGNVRCWGYSATGQLGYGNTRTIGDDETPGAAGPVDVGMNRTATAIAAGRFHTCAVLNLGDVRCWGYAGNGRLGYPDLVNTPPNPPDIGDTEAPSAAGPVNLGAGRTATAITAGDGHTCALLNGGDVRCWGYGGNGQLGYPDPAPPPGRVPNPPNIGDNETPGSAGPVNLGAGRTATAIAAGDYHTCAVLNGGDVRCWGFGATGALGYGNADPIGDDEAPGTVPVVKLGTGRTAKAITAGGRHTCALLDNDSVRCWGYGFFGQLGYAPNTNPVGDDEAPGEVGPVDLGPGRTAVAISAGGSHTCARLDDASVRCWGYGGNGRLGLCNELDVGDDEAPGSVGPVDLQTAGSDCAPAGPGPRPGPAPPGTGGGQSASPAAPPPVPPAAPGGGPGRITGLKARTLSRTKLVLSFRAPESNGPNSPAASLYLVKQARRPIRGARGFRRAQTLCKGRCRFSPPRVGARVKLTITDLRPSTTYYYAVAARDTASRALGPRSRTVKAKTR